MSKDMKVGDLYILNGTLYRCIKVDGDKGLFLLEKRVPTEALESGIKLLIEKTGWDILWVKDGKARLKRDNIAKRMEADKPESEDE